MRCPKPGLLGRGTSIRGGVGAPEVGEKNHLQFFLWDRVIPSNRDRSI